MTRYLPRFQRLCSSEVITTDCVGKHAKDLFSHVAASLGWREVDIASATADEAKKRPVIFCVMQTSDLLKRWSQLGPRSWVSRYFGTPELCDKGNLARMIRSCQCLCPEGHFQFNPRTWVLPEQLEELRSVLEKSKSTYIVKPEDGSQGDGIFLVQGLHQLDIKLSAQSGAAVVQKYISKPLLLHGLKFDLRMLLGLQVRVLKGLRPNVISSSEWQKPVRISGHGHMQEFEGSTDGPDPTERAQVCLPGGRFVHCASCSLALPRGPCALLHGGLDGCWKPTLRNVEQSAIL